MKYNFMSVSSKVCTEYVAVYQIQIRTSQLRKARRMYYAIALKKKSRDLPGLTRLSSVEARPFQEEQQLR